MPRTPTHKWQFRPRFRAGSFGWRSQPAITRVREAVSEIQKVARTDPVLGAEGAVLFLERVSPALQNIDSSSGAIGTAVHRAIDELVPVIAAAPADRKTRDAWLERLFEAHASDDIPYIETLAESWGDLCASPEVAGEWADRLLDITRSVLEPDRIPGEYFHGTSACLSALLAAGRHEQLIGLLEHARFWRDRMWAAEAHLAAGRPEEALRLAEASRSERYGSHGIDAFCEKVLLSTGRVEEAYRHGLEANRAGTYLAWFRAVAAKYPQKEPREILGDLMAHEPGGEGRWFAAAKSAGLLDEAIELVRRAPCDPRTLTRAARDFREKDPGFAMEAGLAALRWLLAGHGYEITALDVSAAHTHTLQAARNAGREEEARDRIRSLLGGRPAGAHSVAGVLTDLQNRG